MAAEDGKSPQVTICLYILDTDVIEKKFEKLKRNTTDWRLIGSNLFVQKIENTAQARSSHRKAGFKNSYLYSLNDSPDNEIDSNGALVNFRKTDFEKLHDPIGKLNSIIEPLNKYAILKVSRFATRLASRIIFFGDLRLYKTSADSCNRNDYKLLPIKA